jgi:hypothetical protein
VIKIEQTPTVTDIKLLFGAPDCHGCAMQDQDSFYYRAICTKRSGDMKKQPDPKGSQTETLTKPWFELDEQDGVATGRTEKPVR